MLISHNLHDVFETADRITVLRLGRNVGVFERRDDAAGHRRGDHRRQADEGLRHPVHRGRGSRAVSPADVVGADKAPPRRSRRRSSPAGSAASGSALG